ncbi:MAG TPA: PRC-barrel domain-containing protein [Blastocatellia bacterium]
MSRDFATTPRLQVCTAFGKGIAGRSGAVKIIMREMRTLDVASELKGMPVFASNTSKKLGEVTDAIVHPTEGKLLGIALLTPEGKERALALGDFQIGMEVVTAEESALSDPKILCGTPAGGNYVCREIVGASVVTDDGNLLGRVIDVYIWAEPSRVLYRVAQSTMQRLFGGFFMAGSVPHSYSSSGLRMIVPVDTKERHAVWLPIQVRPNLHSPAWSILGVTGTTLAGYIIALLMVALALLLAGLLWL